jgi:hypothetical protein
VSLADVARAAVSEIEQYERVVLDMQPGLGVTGNAVADVVHLLAEIIENATTFSARSTQVSVSGHALRSGGALINVIDGGIGMTEERLARVNWRLENPPAADAGVSRHMGLFAVAHLAGRHGIRVRLRKASTGGLVAHVWLPGALISRDSGPAHWETTWTARASAFVQAVTRTARFPQDPAEAEPAAAVSAASAAACSLAAAPLPQAPTVIVPEPSPPPPETRLPIFESVESDWFRARRRPPRRGADWVEPRRAGPPRTSPGDDGWRAARAAVAPATSGLTASGLPRRIPRANLVPGSVGARDGRPSMPACAAEVMSSRLAGFQRGSRRARAAAAPAAPPAVEPP